MGIFDGNKGTHNETEDDTSWVDDGGDGITGHNGHLAKTGTQTTTAVTTGGADNSVDPNNFQLGGSAQQSSAQVGNAAAHGASWDGKTSPWQTGFSDQQNQYLQGLAQRAQGKGPTSSAEMQLQQQTAANQQAQQSLAMSSRGSNAIAGAGMQAAQAQGQLAQQGANQGSQLRAQQQQQAQGQLVNAMGQIRGQNDQQTQSDSARQADMIKFYSQLGFDEQQAQLMANQQMDKLNGEVWWQKLGFKTEQDAINHGIQDNTNAQTWDTVGGIAQVAATSAKIAGGV